MNNPCESFAIFWFVLVGVLSIVGGGTLGYAFGYAAMKRVAERALIKQRAALGAK